MGEKKSKALALELMDDLLNEDTSEIEVEGVTTDERLGTAEQSSAEQSSADLSHSKIYPLDDDATHVVGSSPQPEHDETVQLSDATEVSQPSAFETAAPVDEDRTERIKPSNSSSKQGKDEKSVRASVGRFAPFRSTGPASSTEAALAQSESLRIAQQRLLEFEQEIERLRLQNEELAAAGETLRRRTDELTASNQKRERDYQNLISTFEQEKQILTDAKAALLRDLADTRNKNEELELRISTNIQKIRVRERELENRLELVKMESAALIRSKDEMILELKRNIDQLNMELNNYRTKNQELNKQTNDKQEQLRRTVKALRLALSMLEGEEEPAKGAPAPLRRAK